MLAIAFCATYSKTLSDSSSNHLACALALNFRDAFLNIVHEPISITPCVKYRTRDLNALSSIGM
jgi:hypothetical protein